MKECSIKLRKVVQYNIKCKLKNNKSWMSVSVGYSLQHSLARPVADHLYRA